MNTPLQQAAQELIDRWDSPMWRYQQATTDVIAELRKALDAEITQSVEPYAWLRHDGFKAMTDDEKASWIESGNADVVEEYTKPLYLHPSQPQATTPMSDFDMRGVLASNLMCWHRLTEAEAQDLICFFEKVRPAQGEKP